MSRQPRSDLPDGVYHVTAQAVSGGLLFVDDEDRRAFVWLIGAVTARSSLECRGYCLMGTHYHLLLLGRREDMSIAMRALNGRYARRYNERHARRGHVFGDRYSAYVIRDERHLEEASLYLAANPVLAGLCESVGDWPWTWLADNPTGGCAPGGLPVPAVQRT